MSIVFLLRVGIFACSYADGIQTLKNCRHFLFGKDIITVMMVTHTKSEKSGYCRTERAEYMDLACLDLEGVLVPEIWIAFAEETGIVELKRTTREEPDYNKLMNYRLDILHKHKLGLKEIQATIANIDPLPGAKEFLDTLRSFAQVIIISDTFTQFAMPLMKKLGWPTIFCNELEVAPDGEIIGFHMRCGHSKLTTVRALQSCGFETVAVGDSFNDVEMIKASKAGFLFRSPDAIKKDNAEIPAFDEYSHLLTAFKRALA